MASTETWLRRSEITPQHRVVGSVPTERFRENGRPRCEVMCAFAHIRRLFSKCPRLMIQTPPITAGSRALCLFRQIAVLRAKR
jgi:hypothetical protein